MSKASFGSVLQEDLQRLHGALWALLHSPLQPDAELRLIACLQAYSNVASTSGSTVQPAGSAEELSSSGGLAAGSVPSGGGLQAALALLAAVKDAAGGKLLWGPPIMQYLRSLAGNLRASLDAVAEKSHAETPAISMLSEPEGEKQEAQKSAADKDALACLALLKRLTVLERGKCD